MKKFTRSHEVWVKKVTYCNYNNSSCTLVGLNSRDFTEVSLLCKHTFCQKKENLTSEETDIYIPFFLRISFERFVTDITIVTNESKKEVTYRKCEKFIQHSQ